MKKKHQEEIEMHVRGVDNEVVQQLKNDILAEVKRLDAKIESSNVLSERLFGGLTEEILKTTKKHVNNRYDIIELSNIHSK